MSERIATLIGATGLIGGELLSLLLDDDYFDKVRILIRRPFTMIVTNSMKAYAQ